MSFITVDAPFAHHPAAAAVVAVAVAIVALGAPGVARTSAGLPGWRNAWSLIGLGPGLVVFMLLSGNLGQVIVGADLDFRAAALALAVGAAVGVVWTWALIRSGVAVGWALLSVAAVVFIVGFMLIDARTPAAGVGAGLLAAALPALLAPMVPRLNGSPRVAPSVVAMTIGLLLLRGAVVCVLFVLRSRLGAVGGGRPHRCGGNRGLCEKGSGSGSSAADGHARLAGAGSPWPPWCSFQRSAVAGTAVPSGQWVHELRRSPRRRL